mmetsp:Transcript_23666/g.26115  ORF Transcript_23666/g.26115 Transcript_23666/m.26115 type:complete len:195 (-) Transcript_23666:9-593(-)
MSVDIDASSSAVRFCITVSAARSTLLSNTSVPVGLGGIMMGARGALLGFINAEARGEPIGFTKIGDIVGESMVGCIIVGGCIVGGYIVGVGIVKMGIVGTGIVEAGIVVVGIVVVGIVGVGIVGGCPIVCIIVFIVVFFTSFEEVSPTRFEEGAIALLMIESDDSVELFVILFDFNSSAFFSIAKAYAIASSAD